MPPSIERAREDITACYTAAIDAVNPARAVKNRLRIEGSRLSLHGEGSLLAEYELSGFKRILVIGCGKAGAPMARAVEELLGERISAGCIAVKYGYTDRLSRVALREAAHPVPDQKGREAAGEILRLASDAGRDDLIISLISGGGSALLPLPPEGITLDEKRETTSLLLKSGASIHEMNAVRKHLSLVKGGNLARAAYPATVISMMISDVVGDTPDVIASGPFVPDESSFPETLEILEKYRIDDRVPRAVLEHLRAGAQGKIEETPKRGDPIFERVTSVIIASNIIALKAAREEAVRRGYNTIILSSLVEGETRDAALLHAAIARESIASGNPVPPPACIISGGETTVTVRGKGMGGRNMEFAIHSAVFLEGEERIVLASVGTDGTDGPTDAAGAFADGSTRKNAAGQGLDITHYIRNSDSYNFFKKTGDLIVTGPTNTNVMDIRIMTII